MHFDGTLIRQRVGPMTLFEVRCAACACDTGAARGQRGGRPSFQLLMPVQGEFHTGPVPTCPPPQWARVPSASSTVPNPTS